jgi:hypothetical protein
MWRFFFLVGLLTAVGIGPAAAQEWSGTASLGLSAGHQTNLYLDPVLGTWTPGVDSPYWAVTPRLGLSRNADRTRIDLTVQGRLHPQKADVPQHTLSTLRLRRTLHPDWTLGIVGGGTRTRYPAVENQRRTVRDSWWALPTLRWTPTSNAMLTFRAGLTQRFEQLPTLTDRQTSGLASLRGTYWLSDRVRGAARVYHSGGRTSTADAGFGGSGGSLSATYWPADEVSIRAMVAVEQLRYEDPTRSFATVRDRLGRGGLTVEWTPRPALTIVGRARGATAGLGESPDRTDEHVSVGLRLQTRRVLGGSTEPTSQRRVCESSDDGLRVRVPYEGDGTPHVTGDFNNWSLPGVPLDATDDGTWTTTLELPPGEYEYRIRVVEGDGERWLDLPSYAQTAEDPFGGTNGVCTVQ